MNDGRSLIVLQAAVDLIAAGGAYQHKSLDDVIPDILGTLTALDEFFEPSGCPGCPECEPEGTLQ